MKQNRLLGRHVSFRSQSGLWPCLPIKISTYGVRRFHISRSVWDRVCFPSDNDARPGRHIRSSCRRSLLAIPKWHVWIHGSRNAPREMTRFYLRDDEILFGWRYLRHSLRHYVIVALLRSTRHFDTFSSRHSAYIIYVITLSNSLFDRESVNAYIIYVITL